MKKNFIKDEMTKIIANKLKEFFNEHQSIEVTPKEYDARDLFEKVEGQFGELAEQDYMEHLKERPAQSFEPISFNKDTCYLAFHELVWKEMTTVQKLASILWFNQLIAEGSRKTPMLININGYTDEPIKYIHDETKNIYFLAVNPFLLEDNKQFFGGFILHGLTHLNLRHDMDASLDSIANNEFDKKFDVVTLANYMKQLEVPDYLNEFHYNIEVLNSEERKLALLYLTQPIEIVYRKAFEIANEYMLECQDILGIPDDTWDSYELLMKEEYEQYDKLEKELFHNDEKEKFFETYLKEEIQDINSYLEEKEVK